MRTVLFLLQKEFLQIFRHRIMVALIFAMPIIQLVILANAADYEVRNIRLGIIDRDQSETSAMLSGQFAASPNFEVVLEDIDRHAGLRSIEKGTIDLLLEIPAGMERQLYRQNETQLFLSIDAINGVKAGLANGYAQSIIQTFNNRLRIEWLDLPAATPPGKIRITFSNWYNPRLEYDVFMVPGILVLLVTLVGIFLAGMNIVKEKEIGTIEQINVSPIRKSQFIIGKLLPFWIIGLLELAVGLTVGKLLFRIPFEGSLLVIFAFAAVYLVLVLGVGLLISTFTETQQQAMFIAWFFLVVFILMSGLFTPIESMPAWAQKLTLANPIAYFIDVMRLVLLKGSSWQEIYGHLSIVAALGFGINGLAVWSYRKTS